MIRYVQKCVGYSLTGSTQEQCAFFLYGTGRNGKTTFLEVFRSILGDYAVNIQPETLMVKAGGGSSANSDIARLKAARVVTSEETNEGMRLNEGLLKQLTGGDVVTARKLYSEEFEFEPQFKLWMATNHKPRIRGTDIGIWRRIHLIPFTVQIPDCQVDKTLKYQLRKEIDQIFKWAVDGCLLWQREGISLPVAVQAATQEYRKEMDTIKAFLDDRCEIAPELEMKSSALYAIYAHWCAETNEYQLPSSKFGAEIARRFDKIRHKDGIYYQGIGPLQHAF